MVNAQGEQEDREERLRRMMQTYGDALVSLCTGVLGDADLAQDVVQETFIRAYRSLDRLRNECRSLGCVLYHDDAQLSLCAQRE